MAKQEVKKNENRAEEYLKQRVAVMMKRPETEKKEFRTVSVNGVNYQIAYGKKVMVPRYVAEVIEESEKNEREAQERADEKAEEFASGKSTLEG